MESDAAPFPLRGECKPSQPSAVACMNDRIRKSVAMDLIRNSIILSDAGDDDAADSSVEASEDNFNHFLDSGECDGVFHTPNGYKSPIINIIGFVLSAHCKGKRVCVRIHDPKLVGIPGTTLTIRRVIRTLSAVGTNEYTSASEIKEILNAMAKLCG